MVDFCLSFFVMDQILNHHKMLDELVMGALTSESTAVLSSILDD